MKRLLIFLFLGAIFFDAQAQLPWQEGFSGYAGGEQTGNDNNLPVGADWTTDISNLTLDAGDLFGISAFNDFEATDIDGLGVWTSESIDISSVTAVCFSIIVGHASGTLEPDDFIRVSYSVDGGAFVTLSERFDDFNTQFTDQVCGLSGSTLVVRVEADNDGGFETYYWDNISVVEQETLFSRASGNWDSGTTWSTAALGGASCACTPDATTDVVIGNSNTISLNVDGDVHDITIQNTGTLNWSAANNELNINGGTVTIDSGGAMDENGQTNADLDFENGDCSLVVNDGTTGLDIDRLFVFTAGTLSISGTGIVAIGNDLFITSDNSTVVNDLTGTFTIGDDLHFGAGDTDCSFTNNGTMTVTDDLLFNDDNCTFINNGTFTCDDVFPNNGNDDFNIITNNAAGVLNITGDIDLGDANLTINNSGTINQTGIFNLIDAGSAFNNLDGATWNYGGATFDADMELFCDNGTNTFNYNRAGIQDIITPQDAYSNLTFSGSGRKETGGDFSVTGNITINGGVFNINLGNNDINLAGNWVNNNGTNGGGFNEGNGAETLTLNGASDQSISSPGGEIFRNLVINKPSGSVTLNDQLTIENGGGGGSITFTQGIMNTTSTNILILTGNATSNAGDEDSYVDGPVSKIGTAAYTFPTGDGGKWARIGISGPSVSSTFTAEYIKSAHGDQVNLGTLNNISTEEVWNLDRAGTGTAFVTLFYEDAGFSGINNTGDLTVARYNGANWVDEGSSSAPGGSVTSGGTISSFSPFTFGSNDAVLNPLPVEFISFTGENTDKGNLLDWKTASELNNDFFEVQRSINAASWDVIAKVVGNGTTDMLSEYEYMDARAPIGQVFYRLRQVDFDGAFEYSDVISVVSTTGERAFSMSYYPNPVRGNLSLDIFGLQGLPAKLEVTDISGRTISKFEFRSEENNKFMELDTQNLPSGVYIIKLSSYKGITQAKFIKE